MFDPFNGNLPNEMFRNLGGGKFADVSDSSGIRVLGGVPEGVQGITWAVNFVDYDQDGDVDLFNADDQCGLTPAEFGGIDRGFIQVWENDGTGHFTNVTVEVGLALQGQWMGLAFGDFNHDGHLDFFGTNMGDYALTAMPMSYVRGLSTSRWFLGQADGTFSDPGVGEMLASPFGWATSASDFNNDGHTDIVYDGGINVQLFAVTDNPGTLLLNDGNANFEYVVGAFGNRSLYRNAVGLARGDLNGDGLDDVVSTSSFDLPADAPFFPLPGNYGSPFDGTAFGVALVDDVGDGLLAWNGFVLEGGNLAIDINRAQTTNRSARVMFMGTVGLTSEGRVNRDGVGALARFTPDGGETVVIPVQAGSSHVSQDSREFLFGLARAKSGTLDVMWPGGVHNRLYGVRADENIVMPEIPCNYVSKTARAEYVRCVHRAVIELRKSGHVSGAMAGRLIASALRAHSEK